jgi:hypothetical protein
MGQEFNENVFPIRILSILHNGPMGGGSPWPYEQALADPAPT